MQKGNCYLCGKTLAKSSYRKHFMTAHCVNEEQETANEQDCVLLRIESVENPDYWLYLDAPKNASLKTIDSFLRKIWLECCGHLSGFYSSGLGDIPKSTAIGDFLIGTTIHYDYDFGSTTELKITFVANDKRPKQRSAVRLLCRNEWIPYTCSVCGKPASMIVMERMWDEENPFFCDECLQDEYDIEEALPVVNSPRMGTCAYCGEYDIYEFHPENFQPG